MISLIRALIACAAVALPAAAQAAVVCASLPTFDACVRCGAAKYGYENQVQHCRANWKPAKKKQTISNDEMIKRYGK
jgi:hypothetical protein